MAVMKGLNLVRLKLSEDLNIADDFLRSTRHG